MKLMEQPQLSAVDAAMDALERFFIHFYDQTSSRHHVNEPRVDMLTMERQRCKQHSIYQGSSTSAH